MKQISNAGIFNRVLLNALIASVTNMFVWFALTFWVFVETKSILATSLVAGVFALTNAVSAPFFGAVVDHMKKQRVMVYSSLASLLSFAGGALIYFFAPSGTFTDPTATELWLLIPMLMIGSVVGNLRNIALFTTVTILFAPDDRAKANGLIGSVTGLSFGITSVLSGLAIGLYGMGFAIIAAIVATAFVILHLATFRLPEEGIVHVEDRTLMEKLDWSGTRDLLGTIPGLLPLIFFTTFNNLLGGVFMALMDSYGLSLVSVETWGITFGLVSVSFIAGGLLVSKFGLGKNPVKTLFTLNIITWTTCIFFTVQPSFILLVIGMIIWMLSVPALEASEHTVIQKVIPLERQGRVFGFAQSIEQAATPVTALLIGPLTYFIVIPLMTDGLGAELIGSWFGTGPDRAIALVFTVAGILGLIMTLFARRSRAARSLGDAYASLKEQTV
jgi:MFS transporter, DHA3 family, multidrug efflux protein